MKASIGRMIHVRGGAARSNGTDRAPAVITRVMSDADTVVEPSTVNATVFCDMAGIQLMEGIPLYDTEAEANKAVDGPDHVVAFWPPRA